MEQLYKAVEALLTCKTAGERLPTGAWNALLADFQAEKATLDNAVGAASDSSTADPGQRPTGGSPNAPPGDGPTESGADSQPPSESAPGTPSPEGD